MSSSQAEPEPGSSGIDNELFYDERTMMLFGHAKEAVTDLMSEVRQLQGPGDWL